MLSVNGIYENWHVRLSEPVPFIGKARVMVTIVDEEPEISDEAETDVHLFDELVGIAGEREDGFESHDAYLLQRD